MRDRKRLIARFAIDCGEYFELLTRFDGENLSKEIVKKDDKAKSLMPHYPLAVWFERKIIDDFGLRFEGAFDSRPLLHHERWQKNIYPLRRDFDISTELEYAPFSPYHYDTVAGEGVFEVSVGPIHAGIIEPGHFHFSQAGEDMLHQEVRHFYKYRGIEKILEGKKLSESFPIISRISGNETIAYQIALAKIAKQGSNENTNPKEYAFWALLLELERIIHHWTDLGFIPNDAGFASALAFGSSKAEEGRRLMEKLTGHRFGFEAIFNSYSWNLDHIKSWIDNQRKAIEWFENWISDIPSLWDRMDTTGVLKTKDAYRYSCVGVMARASGVEVDCRSKDPSYQERGFKISMGELGDVASRFKVRIAELKHSLDLMQNFLKDAKPSSFDFSDIKDGEYESFVESSLGELYLYIKIKNEKIERCFISDPSFVNWQALPTMMPGNIIADFPLINKSCDLSYAGNDL